MKFSDLNLPPAVQRALAARGYEEATPVQTAVLNPEHATRDLLVSSQTGSGKTVAFGGAMALTLLAPPEAAAGSTESASAATATSAVAPPSAAQKRRAGDPPVALVVVPTRELAIQVREELGWLLRETKLQLASFTGGTAVSNDLRALQKGVDIGIGTPGRLVDLLRRQRLDLSRIQVLVLDEADEMLDLGFREDLQTLLKAAPTSRRTLLLSATLPSEIRAMARQFQRDAVHVDPRKDGTDPGRGAHDDITYVAHLIAGSDRLAVVVNVLRAAGPGRAIVFCTTREGVSRLHAALLTRGFAATAISGERAQAERDRALGQVRSGDAQILVATNVAARGLHLPDVDLIVHADLPLNAESLTHRSGRTGRAGRKGTAVVLASLTERRKAERLLSMANVPVLWTPPPSPDAISAAARERLAEELLSEAAVETTPEHAGLEQMQKRLEETLSPQELAMRLLRRELARLPAGEPIHPVNVPRPGSSRSSDRSDSYDNRGGRADFDRSSSSSSSSGGAARRPGRTDFNRQGALFRVNIGANDNADPRWLLPLFCRRGGITSREVGAIRVGPRETTFEIAGDAAEEFALAAAEIDPRAPHVIIERASGGGARSQQPDRQPDRRPERSERPPERRPERQPERRPEREPDRRPAPPRDFKPAHREAPRGTYPQAPKPAHAAPPKTAHAAHAPKAAHVSQPAKAAPPQGSKAAHVPQPAQPLNKTAHAHPPKATHVPAAKLAHVQNGTHREAVPPVSKKPFTPPVRTPPVRMAPPPSTKPAEPERPHRSTRPKPQAPVIEVKRAPPADRPFWKDAARRRPNPGSPPPGSNTPKRKTP